MNRRLRAPSPALVISLIALFVALGGTTYAAATSLPANSVGTPQLKNLAVTRTKIANAAVTAAKIDTSGLIVPSALHAGTADSATSAMNTGQLGGVAATGYQRSTLPSGQTERGEYSAWGPPGSDLSSSATFPIRLAAGLDSAHIHFIAKGGTPPAECPGTHASPAAASGNLCIYETSSNESALGGIFATSSGTPATTDSYGFGIYFSTSGSGTAWSYGAWAVTG
jgi:hypothetical protein